MDLDFLGGNGNYPSHSVMEIPSIEDLEESLRKLKVQVDNMASSLSFHPDPEGISSPESVANSSLLSFGWPVGTFGNYEELVIGEQPKPLTETKWCSKRKHLLRSVGDYSALSSVGLPTLARSPTDRVGRPIGSELVSQKVLPSVDLTSPLKLGSPHVVGVKALLPPKIPVRGLWLGRASTSFVRGHPQSLEGAARSRSFSPPAKRPCWHRARSQSPRPAWRPSSAKANASAEPPPQLPRRKNGVSRQLRERIYRPGTLATRSRTLKTPGRMEVRDPWSPYGLASAAISSPTAQEINERFLQALAESSAKRAVMETSPYQRELARLRLERLRVEEAWLLELKRQQELERSRGPRAKWYEMRNSQFHYEARKNNELLRNSREIQAVSKYRHELATASKEFQQQQPSSTYQETRDQGLVKQLSSTYAVQ